MPESPHQSEPQPIDPSPSTARPYASAQFANVVTAVRELQHPSRIGPYIIQELIGEGGMGTVYRAEQREPIRRTVAVKVIKLGMDTREVIARFESERQALAMMNHPNVAKVLDAGATDTGRPYFVMEYVAGEPITAFADRQKLTIRQRLELFIQACDALQHAHQKAIIHRDLKPSNILVTLVDDKPQVKVIDFGVAKAISQRLTEKTLFTETGQLVGTPEYMAPEQAEAALADVDTRSDVYSLGVVLYELLSGALPFESKTLRSAGYNEIQRIIREVDPPRPSTRLSRLGAAAEEVARLRQTPLEMLQRQLHRELDWIPLKAMNKDRTRRYVSATELADDINNHLSNRPLRAAPDSAKYRLRMFIRRNKRGVAAAAAMILILLLGIATTTWQAVHATRQRDIAIAARREMAEAREYEQQTDKFLLEMFTSINPEHARGRAVLVRDVLDQAARRMDEHPPAHAVVEGYVRQIFGGTYRALGLPELALAQLERARTVDPFNDHAAPTRRANLLHKFGITYKDLGRIPEAEENLRAALELFRQANRPDGGDTLEAQASLASLLIETGRIEEAESLLSDAQQRVQRAAEIDLESRINVINQLAHLRVGQGRFAEAEARYRDALQLLGTEFDQDHPQVLAVTNNLADVLRTLGKPAEAVELYERILEPASLAWGLNHLSTLVMMNNYALGLEACGRREEAEPVYLKVIQRVRDAHDEDHPLALLARSNYGLLLIRTGRLDEAENTFADVAPRMKRVNGADHPDTIIAEGNLAQVRVMRGDLDGAAAIYRELLPRTKQALGAAHPAPVALSMRYGELLMRQEKWSDAEPLLADAYAGASAQGIESRQAVAGGAYGICLTQLKKYEQAEAPLRAAYDRFGREDVPLPLEQRRAVLAALIEAAENRGRGDEAARYRDALGALESPAATQPQH